MWCCDVVGFRHDCWGLGGGEFLITSSNASSSCAVPRRCRRSVFEALEFDFLLARLANEYVSSIDSSLVSGSSLDRCLDMADIVVCVYGERRKAEPETNLRH